MMKTIETASQIAKAVGIAPRTKRYRALNTNGYPLLMVGEAERWEEVFYAIRAARTDRQTVSMRTFIVVCALTKAMHTCRMNVHLARRIREQYTPYQLCMLVAKISAKFEGQPSIGELADEWINKHADQL